MEKMTFKRYYFELVRKLSDDERLEVYDSIFRYFFDGCEGVKSKHAAYKIIRMMIESDCRRTDEILEKRRDAGRKGGLAKARKNLPVEEPQTPPEPEPEPEPEPVPVVREEERPEPATIEPATTEPPKEPKPKPQKKRYAEFVLMTEDEYKKLQDAHGEEGAKWMVTKLDNYKAARGMTYKSDYRAILNWVVPEYQKQKIYGNKTYPRIDQRIAVSHHGDGEDDHF